VTLEHCDDDGGLVQMAKALGKDADYEYFMKRAHSYQNLLNPRMGFMAPKKADGKRVEPFDSKLSAGFAGEAYFAECNSWIYTWPVQHDEDRRLHPGLRRCRQGHQSPGLDIYRLTSPLTMSVESVYIRANRFLAGRRH